MPMLEIVRGSRPSRPQPVQELREAQDREGGDSVQVRTPLQEEQVQARLEERVTRQAALLKQDFPLPDGLAIGELFNDPAGALFDDSAGALFEIGERADLAQPATAPESGLVVPDLLGREASRPRGCVVIPDHCIILPEERPPGTGGTGAPPDAPSEPHLGGTDSQGERVRPAVHTAPGGETAVEGVLAEGSLEPKVGMGGAVLARDLSAPPSRPAEPAAFVGPPGAREKTCGSHMMAAAPHQSQGPLRADISDEQVPDSQSDGESPRIRRLSRSVGVAPTDQTASSRFHGRQTSGVAALGAPEARVLPMQSIAALGDGGSDLELLNGLQDRQPPMQRNPPNEPLEERRVLAFRSDNDTPGRKATASKRKRALDGAARLEPRRRSGRWIDSSPETSDEENVAPAKKEPMEISHAESLQIRLQAVEQEPDDSLDVGTRGQGYQNLPLRGEGARIDESAQAHVASVGVAEVEVPVERGLAREVDVEATPQCSSWERLLRSAQALSWEGLSNGQRNQAASSVLLKFPQQSVEIHSAEPDFVAQDSSSQESFSIISLNDLKHAFDTLLCLAGHIPERQLGPLISKRLFYSNPRTLLQFSKSDMRPRAIMLNAGFSFLKVLKQRKLAAEQYIPSILESVAALGAEYEELHAIKESHSLINATKVIGCTEIPAARNLAESEKRKAIVEEAMRGNELLLEITLAHIEVAIKSSLKDNFEFLSSDLSDFLEARRPFPASIRKRVLSIVSSCISASRREEVGNQMEERAAKVLLDIFWIPLDSIIAVEYPLRKGLSSIPQEIPNLEGEDLSGKAMQALSSIAALRLHCKLWSWDDVEKEALKPFGPALFWSSSLTRQRHFGFKFLSAVVFNLNQYSHTLSESESLGLLKVWLLAMLDPSQNTVQVVATVSMKQLPCLDAYLGAVPRDPMQTLHSLKADKDGSQRSGWVAECFRQAVTRNRMSPVNSWPVTIRECFTRWLKEIELISFLQCQTWRFTFCRVMTACLLVGDISCEHLYQPARGDSGTILSILLKFLVSEVVQSASALRKTSVTFHEAASAELLNEIGEARERVKKSALGCLPGILGSIADSKCRDPGVLQFLHTICVSIIEPLPGFPTRVSAIETAIYEIFAAAIAPSSSGAPGFQPASKPFQMCHYFVGTYCRRWLIRSSFRHASCEKQAVNCLRAISFIFSQVSCRSATPFQSLLALLFGPFLECVSPENDDMASDRALTVLYDFWTNLVRSHPEIVTAPDDTSLTASLHNAYNGNLLLTGGALPPDAFGAGAWVTLHSICRKSLNTIGSALAARHLTPDEVQGLLKSWKNSGGSSELESFKTAKASLFRTLGRPLPIQAIESLYSRPSIGSTSWNVQAEGENMNSEEVVRNAAAQSAMRFLISLAKSGHHGQKWAAQLVPTVCFSMNSAKAMPPGSEMLYDELRSQCADAILSEFALKPKNIIPAGDEDVPITAFGRLGDFVGKEISIQGNIRERDPSNGTKPLKTQKNVVTLTLIDGHGGEVCMLCAGASAVRVARTLDNSGKDCGTVRFGPVRVFVRRDNGSVMLQGLNKTTVTPHIRPL